MYDCDYMDDMEQAVNIFECLIEEGFCITYSETLATILKQLCQEACSSPHLRKYVIKLHKFKWMRNITASTIIEAFAYKMELNTDDEYDNESPCIFSPYIHTKPSRLYKQMCYNLCF